MSDLQPPDLLTPVPKPPDQVRYALSVLEIVHNGDEDAISELGDIDDLPQPWDPTTCPRELRRQVWLWCDDMAMWINREYAWRPSSLIPGCWSRHPHIARELPGLSCLHYTAASSAGPELLEEWHRHTLPLFLDRLGIRLGESTCRTGRHQDWPSASRYDVMTSVSSTGERCDFTYLDVS